MPLVPPVLPRLRGCPGHSPQVTSLKVCRGHPPTKQGGVTMTPTQGCNTRKTHKWSGGAGRDLWHGPGDASVYGQGVGLRARPTRWEQLQPGFHPCGGPRATPCQGHHDPFTHPSGPRLWLFCSGICGWPGPLSAPLAVTEALETGRPRPGASSVSTLAL